MDEPVKKLREEMGLSQSQFAKWIGAGIRTVQHWEQGRSIQRSTRMGLLAMLFIQRVGLMWVFKRWLKEEGEGVDKPEPPA